MVKGGAPSVRLTLGDKTNNNNDNDNNDKACNKWRMVTLHNNKTNYTVMISYMQHAINY